MKKKLLFVSQDQGSGNALFPVINKLLLDESLLIRVFAARQSKNVFRKQGISFKNLDNIDFDTELDFKPDLIVTGSSMRECVEKEALRVARSNNIKSVSILDFWGNYWKRFTVDGEHDPDTLPDYIFIMDEIAKEKMISEGFPERKLIITGNPYFDTFTVSGSKKQNSYPRSVLFVSQPVFRDGSYQTDPRILEDILEVFDSSGDYKLVVRPHPKDDRWAFSKYRDDNLMVKTDEDIAQLIKDCNIVIGKDSTVLFEAVFRGKLVISYQPVPEKSDWLVSNQLGLSYLVRSKNELESILKKAINKKLKKKELAVFKNYNDGKCTERVIKNIKFILT